MSEVQLSVEVLAKMQSLSDGLKKGKEDINDFVNSSIPGLENLQRVLNSLGVNTSVQGINNLSNAARGLTSSTNESTASLVSQRIATEAQRTATNAAKAANEAARAALVDATVATQNQRTATEANRAALEAQRAATERARGVTEANRTAVQRAAEVSQQNTSALIAQRTATEAQRTAAAAATAQLNALRLANAANRTATIAASGSYQEAQQRLKQLGIQIRSVSDGFKSQSPLMQARIAEYNKLNQSLKDFDAKMGNHQRNVGNYSGALQSAGAGLLSMVSGYMSLGSALSYVFDQTLKFDRIKTPLAFVLGSDGDANMKLKELKGLANDLGLEYFTLATSYKQFTAAAMASNFPLKESEKIFTSVSKAAAVLKLSDEQLKGSLLALQQMISKGNVQAEELRGQLAERLPGAFSLAAKAMGVTETQLNKLLKNGEVLASDLLPKLALQLDKRYGDKAADGIKGLSAELGRLQTAMQALGGEGSALSDNVFQPVIRGARLLAQELSNTFKGSAWENLQRFMTFTNSGRENIDRSYNTRDQYKDSKSSLSGSMERQYTGMDVGELRNYYEQIQKSAIAAENNYRQFQTGIKAGKLKEEFDGQLQSFKELSQNLLAERKMIGSEIDRQKEKAKNNKSEIADLKSIKAIRDEITRLSGLPGSSTKGSDISNRILALKAQLKDLNPSTAKPSTRIFDTVEKQLQDFHNKANIITKEGLAKDLQEWDDKYGKIKASIDKLPAGEKKTKATATLETQYKDGRANIIDASSKKITEAIKKRNEAINAADLDGMAKEIQAVNANYDEQVRLAEGNKDGIIALRNQQAEEISKIERDHAAADTNTIVKQMADIATEYREHKAEMALLALTNGPAAVEIAENERLKDELKRSYLAKLTDFETYQAELAKLVAKGNELEVKPPLFDVKHFQDIALEAKKSVNDIMKNFVDSGISGALSGMFENMGASIAEGGSVIEAAGKGMKDAFVELMKALGQQFMAMGIARIAAGTLELTNPFTAAQGALDISSGTGLVALGGGLMLGGGIMGAAGSSKGTTDKGLPKFAMGVQNFGGGLAIVGERGPEIVNIPTGSHVIPNHKVIQGINSGGQTQVMIPEVRLSGQDLYIAFKRTERNNKRG